MCGIFGNTIVEGLTNGSTTPLIELSRLRNSKVLDGNLSLGRAVGEGTGVPGSENCTFSRTRARSAATAGMQARKAAAAAATAEMSRLQRIV